MTTELKIFCGDGVYKSEIEKRFERAIKRSEIKNGASTERILTPRFFDPAELEVEDMGVYDLTEERCRLVDMYIETKRESDGQESEDSRFIYERLEAVLERLRNIVSDIFVNEGQSEESRND